MLKRIAMLALLGVSLASAKTYTVTVPDSAQAGKFNRSRVSTTSNWTDRRLCCWIKRASNHAAKVEVADRKFDSTAISISKADGTNRIQWIELGGSKNRVVFQ